MVVEEEIRTELIGLVNKMEPSPKKDKLWKFVVGLQTSWTCNGCGYHRTHFNHIHLCSDGPKVPL